MAGTNTCAHTHYMHTSAYKSDLCHILSNDCVLQVFMLALAFLVLFLGNFLTTLKVVHQKVQKNNQEEEEQKKN